MSFLLHDCCQSFTANPSNVAYLDIKSAFNYADHTALWKDLYCNVVTDILIHLIAILHKKTVTYIGVSRKLLLRISTTTDFR